MQRYTVDSKRVQYNSTTNTLLSAYDYQSSQVQTGPDGRYRVVPTSETLTFRTKCRVPRVGCMLVGWGGNNGSTVTACVLANKMKLQWRTKEGVKVRSPLDNYYRRVTYNTRTRRCCQICAAFVLSDSFTAIDWGFHQNYLHFC